MKKYIKPSMSIVEFNNMDCINASAILLRNGLNLGNVTYSKLNS